MDLYSTSSGRSIVPQFPPESVLKAWPELLEGIENARRLEREYQEALAAHAAAETALGEAIASDRAELAAARFKGEKKLPAAKHVEAAKAAVEEAVRQRDAADDARRFGGKAVLDAVEQNRDRWQSEADELEESARAEEEERLAAYLAAVEVRSLVSETRRWLAEFPRRRIFKPGASNLVRAGGREPIPWPEVVHGLRVRVGLEAPAPRTLPEQVAHMAEHGVPLGVDGKPSPSMTPEAA
jgi:hypothetical protein